MATLASQHSSPSLPSVKCSTCGRLVPLTQLPAHICASSASRLPPPSSPTFPPPGSPTNMRQLPPPNMAGPSHLMPNQRPMNYPPQRAPSADPQRLHPNNSFIPPRSNSAEPGRNYPPPLNSQFPGGGSPRLAPPPPLQPFRGTPPGSPQFQSRTLQPPPSPRGPPNNSNMGPPTGPPGQGADAGMAGVGRRAFQAAAHAALLATSLSHGENHAPARNIPTPSNGDGGRTNSPQYLNIQPDRGEHRAQLSIFTLFR